MEDQYRGQPRTRQRVAQQQQTKRILTRSQERGLLL